MSCNCKTCAPAPAPNCSCYNPVVDPKDIKFDLTKFCVLKDPCGKPMTNPNMHDVVVGLDELLCDLIKRLGDCCSVTKNFNVCLTGKIRLVSLRRGTTFVGSNLYFESVGALMNYLIQFDSFTYAAGVISVKSVFDWQLHVECEATNCDLVLTINPPNYQSC